MTALTTPRRQQVRSDWGQKLSVRRELMSLSRVNTDAAIAAVDDWIETNASSFNTALPTAAKNTLTAGQKAELLSMVALARFGG